MSSGMNMREVACSNPFRPQCQGLIAGTKGQLLRNCQEHVRSVVEGSLDAGGLSAMLWEAVEDIEGDIVPWIKSSDEDRRGNIVCHYKRYELDSPEDNLTREVIDCLDSTCGLMRKILFLPQGDDIDNDIMAQSKEKLRLVEQGRDKLIGHIRTLTESVLGDALPNLTANWALNTRAMLLLCRDSGDDIAIQGIEDFEIPSSDAQMRLSVAVTMIWAQCFFELISEIETGGLRQQKGDKKVQWQAHIAGALWLNPISSSPSDLQKLQLANPVYEISDDQAEALFALVRTAKVAADPADEQVRAALAEVVSLWPTV